MFLISKKELKIAEYTNLSVATKGKHLKHSTVVHNPLTFNGARLSYAIAKTLTSHSLGFKEFWLDCIMSFLGVKNIVAPSSPEFKLLESRLIRLRDFTRTTRIGETAQGIAYLFAQDVLEYPLVCDFDYFFSQKGVIIPKDESTPDFVLQKKVLDKNISLLESKGTEINSLTPLKAFLRDGLTQCDNGAILSAKTGYAINKKHVTCAEFSFDTVTENSTLHYVDPSDKMNISEFDDSLLRVHYASWFYLIGDFDNVDRLIKGLKIIFNKNYFSEYQHEGEKFYVFSTFNLFNNLLNYFENLGFRKEQKILLHFDPFFKYLTKGSGIIGISEKIINHLTGEKTFVELPSFKLESQKNEEVSLFLDGIILFQNRNIKLE